MCVRDVTAHVIKHIKFSWSTGSVEGVVVED